MKIRQAPDSGKRGSARQQHEERLMDQLEACEKKFPHLDGELLRFFQSYRKGAQYNNMPIEHRTVMDRINKQYENEFHGRLPSPNGLAAAPKKPRAPKAEKPHAPLPADEEMASIARADPSMCNTEIAKYWMNFISKYSAFQGKHGKPSPDSQDSDALYFAKGYEFCLHLANAGRLPLEVEIRYSKINQQFDIAGAWRKKLETRNQMFFENGVQPSFAIASQCHLAHWLYVVSNLHTRGELPYEPSWLSVNFKPLPAMPAKSSKYYELVHDLRGYMEFARIVGEENIKRGSVVYEAARWAEWRELVSKLHSKDALPQDLVLYLKASGAKLLGD